MNIQEQAAFLSWWNDVGSGIVPARREDREEHACRVAAWAWEAALIDERNRRAATPEQPKYSRLLGDAGKLPSERMTDKLLEAAAPLGALVGGTIDGDRRVAFWAVWNPLPNGGFRQCAVRTTPTALIRALRLAFTVTESA
jgi:hypothetical protein